MGVTCEAGRINVAAVADGEVLEDVVERIPAPTGLEEHDRLWAVHDDVIRAIKEIKPEKIVILCAESRYTASHKAFTPRIALETVVRLAGAKEDVPVELLSRPTVRSRLDLPKKGGLDAHLNQAIPKPVGRYWTAGRGLAAMAALAGEQG